MNIFELNDRWPGFRNYIHDLISEAYGDSNQGHLSLRAADEILVFMDAHIARSKAEAWDEGAQAEADTLLDEHAIAAGEHETTFVCPSLNPYRSV